MPNELLENLKLQKRKFVIVFLILGVVLITSFFICEFVGTTNISFLEKIKAFFGQSTKTNNQIMLNIRMPRVLAALTAGAGLSVAGLIMQTILGNQMASPSTLGVSNAAAFGANISLLVFAGGFINSGNSIANYTSSINGYQTVFFSLLFSIGSIFFILGLCKIRSFNPSTIVLAGIAIGSIWTAGTTILQYYSTDIGLSASVVWTFGDLGRATYLNDIIMGSVVLLGSIFFILNSWKYNSILSGEEVATSVGINIKRLRFFSLLIASIITAVCVSFLGIIGFVGIICPHVMKKILGNNHKVLIPSSLITGSILLLLSDTLSRVIGNGSALPIGAITSILGAPFFLSLLIGKKDSYARR